ASAAADGAEPVEARAGELGARCRGEQGCEQDGREGRLHGGHLQGQSCSGRTAHGNPRACEHAGAESGKPVLAEGMGQREKGRMSRLFTWEADNMDQTTPPRYIALLLLPTLAASGFAQSGLRVWGRMVARSEWTSASSYVAVDAGYVHNLALRADGS